MKLIVVLVVLVAFVLHLACGSCLSYGHSCWGAHGKRSGNAAAALAPPPQPSADLGQGAGKMMIAGLASSNPQHPEQMSLAQRWALYRLRDGSSASAADMSGSDEEAIEEAVAQQDARDAASFALSLADVRAIRREQQQQQQQIGANKRALAMSGSDEIGLNGDLDGRDGQDEQERQALAKSSRLFRQLSPKMRRFLLGQLN